MEFTEVVRSRRMTRHFLPDPVDDDLLDQLFSLCLRSPSAGSSRGVELLVLTRASTRARLWEAVGDPEWRRDEQRSQGLVQAPVIVVPCARPDVYLERYAQPDKASSSLFGLTAESWPVPYWSVDAAFVAMTLLLSVTDVGLGALFFHLHGREQALLEAFDVPVGTVTIGAVAIGIPDGATPTRRLGPARRGGQERVHRERW